MMNDERTYEYSTTRSAAKREVSVTWESVPGDGIDGAL